MSTLWRQQGESGVIGDSSGNPVSCVDCPCPVDAELCACILERQKAANEAEGDWIKCGNYYSMARLRGFVNDSAQRFLDGTYTGGASGPSRLPGDYADSATDQDELLALVKDMLTTVYTYYAGSNFLRTEYYEYSGTTASASGEATEQDAIDAAEADWAETTYWASQPVAWAATQYFGVLYTYVFGPNAFGKYNATTWTAYAHLKVLSLSAAINKTVRFFLMPTVFPSPAVYDEQGATLPTEDEYGLMSTVVAGAAVTAETGNLTGTGLAPNWTNSGPAESYGFQLRTKPVALIDWSFSCV